MKYSSFKAAVVAAAAGLFIAGFATGTQAQDTTSDKEKLFTRTAVLTIAPEDGSEMRSHVIHCGADSSHHPHHDAACEQLDSTSGQVNLVPIVDTLCTMEYDPVELRAWIMWEGEYHQFQGDFGNPCQANSETGGVLFDF